MNQTRDTVWQRRGTSWLWDAEALAQVCTASEAWSLRQFIQATGHWPDDLPSNYDKTLVVAGLDGCLDLLTPPDAENWLGTVIKESIQDFQENYGGEAALIFWLPAGAGRLSANAATDAVSWRCGHPNATVSIDFGRVLWGEAHEYPQEIMLPKGVKPAGLFHGRIT